MENYFGATPVPLGDGHQKTVDEVVSWIKESGAVNDMSFCDAGCGVGSLTLPLASLGAGSVHASDISAAMVQEAERRAREAELDPEFAKKFLNFIIQEVIHHHKQHQK